MKMGLGLGLTRGWGAPALDLNFLNGTMPAAGLTFTRAGGGGRINSSGLYEWVGADVPRFDYDPITLACKGLLIEESRTNLMDYSEEFDRSVNWPLTGLSVSANTTFSPRADLTADTILEDTSTGFHRTLKGVSVAAGVTYTLSVFVKANGRNRLNLHLGGTAMTFTIVAFDLATASVTSGSGQIKDVGGGWYRVSAQAPATGTGSGTFGVEILDAGGNRSYTGDGTSGIYVWGAGLQAGAFNTSHIPTVASAVTRAADVLTMTGADFSRWFNPLEGTIVAEFSTITNGLSNTGGNAFPFIYDIDSAAAATSGHTLIASAVYGPGFRSITSVSGVNQAEIQSAATLGTGTIIRHAYTYKANDFAAVLNGGTVLTDVLGSLPTPNRLSIGSQDAGGSNTASFHIRRIRYYPRRLSNARLQELSA